MIDHLGSVVAMSDTAGHVVGGSLARYDPFGNYRTWPGSNVNPTISDRGFTGHVHDNTGDYPTENVGLIYMNARYYLPEVGRFVSADTIVPEPSNPQDWNRYTYTQNNPITYTDPSGHLSVEEIEQYFGFTDKQQMVDQYGQAVTDQLWDTPFTWGDVLQYSCPSCQGGSGYAILLLLGNQSDEFRGAFWGLQASYNGYDLRGKEIGSGLLKGASDANLDLAWTQAMHDYEQIPVDYEAYGMSYDTMVAGTWHDVGVWRPLSFVASKITPVVVVPAAVWTLYDIVTETAEATGHGHPFGAYYRGYPTIKVANHWGYLPIINTYTFIAPPSVHR